MNTLAPSFLIGSSSFLQVSRTCMKAWMSSNFGKFATELRPLIDVRIKFLLNILKTNRPIKTKGLGSQTGFFGPVFCPKKKITT